MIFLYFGIVILKNDWEYKLKDYLWFGYIWSESGCFFRCLMRLFVKNNWNKKMLILNY